jgi:hypothetical protein
MYRMFKREQVRLGSGAPWYSLVRSGDDIGAGVDLRSAMVSLPVPRRGHGKGLTVMAMYKERDLSPLETLIICHPGQTSTPPEKRGSFYRLFANRLRA